MEETSFQTAHIPSGVHLHKNAAKCKTELYSKRSSSTEMICRRLLRVEVIDTSGSLYQSACCFVGMWKLETERPKKTKKENNSEVVTQEINWLVVSLRSGEF